MTSTTPCFTCGQGIMTKVVRDFTWNAPYLKSPVLVPNLPHTACSHCDEVVMSLKAIKHAEPYLKAYYTDEYKQEKFGPILG